MAKQMDNELAARPRIAEIESAAEDYVKVRDKRMRLTEQEVECKRVLLEVMQSNSKDLPKNGEGEVVYRFDDELVILKVGKANVKVRHATDPDEDEED